MRVVPRYRGLTRALPRRLRWTRQRLPTRRPLPTLHRPEGRRMPRPSASVSLRYLFFIGTLVAAVWGAGALFQSVYAERIYPHVTIDRVPVGGLTRAQALAVLRDTETARIDNPLYVQATGHLWQVTPALFGTQYDVAHAVDRALALAHHGPFLLGGWNELTTLWEGSDVSLTGRHDDRAVRHFLQGLASALYRSPVRADVGVRGGGVAIVRQPVDGRELDVPAAAVRLGQLLNTHEAVAITLPLRPVQSALGYPQADAVLARAQHLLANAPLTFSWSSQSWQLTRDGLLHLLTFTPQCQPLACRFTIGINTSKLADAFNRGGVAQTIDRAPIAATYVLQPASNPTNARVGIYPESNGQAIDVARAADAVLQQATAGAQDTHVIFLPIKPLLPTFTEADAQALNFNNAVGYGAVQLPPTLDWARLNNLNVAANVISDTIVPPDHTFSVALKAGPLVGGEYGYTPGQNVIGPGDVTGVNSGVDALAAAVLAASYDAGLSIVHRTAYPYPTIFSPPGLDAVVSYDSHRHAPDLTVRNTTDHAILIMTSNNRNNGVGIYIFNSGGYAPGHRRAGAGYRSQVSLPQLTLQPDGAVDSVVTRQIIVGHLQSNDRLSSHYATIDP